METTTNPIIANHVIDAPTLEIMALLPEQGTWQESDYLWLTDHTNRLVEWSNGSIEVLPTPTDKHQAILQYLLGTFDQRNRYDPMSQFPHHVNSWHIGIYVARCSS